MKPFDEIPPGTEDRSRALLEQANALFREGRFKASEVTFKRVIDRGSNVAEGFYGVGVVRLSLNDQAAAETNFRRALEHNPWHANALYQLGLMAEQREDLEEARSYYRKALASKPEHVGAQKGLARLSDSDPQNTPAETNDYDRQSERLQETMIVRLEKPVELVVEDSKIFVAGTRFAINKETTSIGRSSASDIDLVNDETASKVHAQLTRHGEQLYVEDLGSTNGTYVNGERITGVVPLRLGDELRVGITSLRRVDSDASTDAYIRPPVSAATNSEAQPERIELRYDKWGGRLRWIADTEINYDMLGSRPRWLGNMELRYDKWGSRLKWVGAREVQYDWAGSRPRWLGNMELQYDQWGNRLRWVGDVELHYERWGLGSRLRWIGDLELGYEEGFRGWFDDRPKYIMLPDEHSQLSVEKLLLVFFVLYEKNRREEEQRKRFMEDSTWDKPSRPST
jgi:pSer/pThr/pTyr-binding forkhead associated (FHA) protein